MQLSVSNIFPLISLLLALWAVALRRKDSRYKGGIAWFAGLAIALNILMFWISPWSYGALPSSALTIVVCGLCIIFFIISLVKKNRLLTLYSVVIPIIIVLSLYAGVFGSSTPMYDTDDKNQIVAQTTEQYSQSLEAATTAPIPDITTEDIEEKTFTACNKTMYVHTTTILRQYPSTNSSLSPALRIITSGTYINVIAESPLGWYKVEYSDFYNNLITGFVMSDYLS